MSQNWQPLSSTDTNGVLLLTYIPDRFESLRTVFSGSSAPSSPVAYQLWADTTTGLLKQRNGANSAWVTLIALANTTRFAQSLRNGGALSAATLQMACPSNCYVDKLLVVPDTTSSGSGSGTKEWTFALRNVTQAVELFSANPGTGTVVGGVGGGEFTANTAYVLTPNQNVTPNVNDVLKVTISKVGAPTTIVDCSVALIGYGRT